MREAFELIEMVYWVGGEFTIYEDRINVKAPKGAISPQLKKELRKAKPQLLELSKWDFQKIRIPSQRNPKFVDIFIEGKRDDGVPTWWWIGQEGTGKPLHEPIEWS